MESPDRPAILDLLDDLKASEGWKLVKARITEARDAAVAALRKAEELGEVRYCQGLADACDLLLIVPDVLAAEAKE